MANEMIAEIDGMSVSFGKMGGVKAKTTQKPDATAGKSHDDGHASTTDGHWVTINGKHSYVVDHDLMKTRASEAKTAHKAHNPEEDFHYGYEHGEPASPADHKHLAKAEAAGKVALAVESKPTHHTGDTHAVKSHVSKGESELNSKPGATHHIVNGTLVASRHQEGDKHVVTDHLSHELGENGKYHRASLETRFKDSAKADKHESKLVHEYSSPLTSSKRLLVSDPHEPRHFDTHGDYSSHQNTTFRVIHRKDHAGDQSAKTQKTLFTSENGESIEFAEHDDDILFGRMGGGKIAKSAKKAKSKTPSSSTKSSAKLEGGIWKTVHGSPIYIKGGEIVAGGHGLGKVKSGKPADKTIDDIKDKVTQKVKSAKDDRDQKHGFKSADPLASTARQSLSHDLRSARKNIKDKDDRDTFNRHARLLRRHRRGEAGSITHESAQVIRDRFRKHGEAAKEGRELPGLSVRQQAEAHKIERERTLPDKDRKKQVEGKLDQRNYKIAAKKLDNKVADQNKTVTSEQYAKQYGITHSEASDHLRNLYQKGHVKGGMVGGTYSVPHDAPKHPRSVAKTPIQEKDIAEVPAKAAGKPTASDYWNGRRDREAKNQEIRNGGKDLTPTQYAQQHGITNSEASNHLRDLYQKGHVKAGSIGGTYVVPHNAAKHPNSKSDIKPSKEDSQPAPHEHDNHEPGYVGHLNTSLIHADPHRFQYKQGASDTGSVGSLAGVKKYDENLGGVIQVWKDPADHKTYVVNGHNRLDLAKKLGADKVTVRYLDAKDHQQARSIGALTNIAEGRGTAVDAAKFFRDTNLSPKAIEERGIPLREKIATDGIALSKLNNSLFNKVTIGDMTPARGAIIGAADLNPSQQNAVAKLVDSYKGKQAITDAHLKEIVGDVKDAPVAKGEGKDGGLFGWSKEDESLALHKTKVQASIKERLGSEKKLFGGVAKSKAAEDLKRGGNHIDTEQSGNISREAAQTLDVFDRFKRLHGPVSRTLNDAAERIHKGENARKVTDDAYRQIVKHIPEMLAGGHSFAP